GRGQSARLRLGDREAALPAAPRRTAGLRRRTGRAGDRHHSPRQAAGLSVPQLLPNLIGALAALCSMTSFVPQIVKIWRDRDASEISLRMYLITVTGFSLWIAYGVLTRSWPVAVSNAVCLALSSAILALKWRF